MKRGHLIPVALSLLLVVTSAWGDPVAKDLYYLKKTVLSYPATYTFRFSLWNADTEGTETWSEEKSVKMTTSTLKTYLGDTISLDGIDFSQQLWVQVERKKKNGTYVLIGQRDPLAIVPYALWSATSSAGGAVTGIEAGEGLTSVISDGNVTLRVGEGTGITVTEDAVSISPGGITNNMLASGSVTDDKIAGPLSAAKMPHTHSGSDITTGTVAEAVIDSVVARDNEVMSIVLSSDGAGSGLDADLLDGQHASAFASSSHAHAGADITSGTIDSARLNIGTAAGQVAAGDHTHSFDAAYVNADGDTINGNLIINTGEFSDLTLTEEGIARSGDLTLNALNNATDSTVNILNSDETFAANLIVEGAVTAAAFVGNGSGLTNVPPAAHVHSGADITSGTIAAAQIDTAIARDSEIMPTVLAADGSGSGLDADLLDGLHAGAFATSVHAHSGADITSGTVDSARLNVGTGANQVAAGNHSHNYDATYVNVTGDTMTGSLNLPSNGLVVGTNQLSVSGGNVGIGTTTPSKKFDVLGDTKITGTSGNGQTAIELSVNQSSSNKGGGIQLIAGQSPNSWSANHWGGDILIKAGSGYNNSGGDVQIEGGYTSSWTFSTTPTKVNIYGGPIDGDYTNSGLITVESGKQLSSFGPDRDGGHISLMPGAAKGSGLSGNVGVGTTSPTAKMDVNGPTGFNQLRVRTSYTPTGTVDPNGNVGDIAWDDDYVYVKTNAGWKRTVLATW
jgi:hypothetical protein